MEKFDVAIVIGIDHHNTLGIIRSLGLIENLNVVLLLISKNKFSYVSKSKYIEEFHIIENNENVILNHILEISKRYRKTFIFPLTDETAFLIDKNHKIFNDNICFPHMYGKMKEYLNKATSKEYAKEAGLDIVYGSTFSLTDLENFDNLESYKFPLIIKPLVSKEGLKSDISIVDNNYDLKISLESFSQKKYKEVLVEEYIDSQDSYMLEVMGYSTEENVVITGIVKKIREYPIRNGSTSYAQLIDYCELLKIDAIKKYIKSSRYIGLFDIEFKYSGGTFYFIECNFRNGAPNYAVTKLNGINTPGNWILAMQNISVPTKKDIVNNRIFMIENMDLLNLLKGNIPIMKWINDVSSCNFIFFDSRDLIPNFWYCIEMLKIIIHKFV